MSPPMTLSQLTSMLLSESTARVGNLGLAGIITVETGEKSEHSSLKVASFEPVMVVSACSLLRIFVAI